jgi:hypothetical protein
VREGALADEPGAGVGLLGVGWREDLDAVRRGKLREERGIGRDRLGQPQGRGWLARRGDELMIMIRPGPVSETAKPCGIARGINTSEPGPARQLRSPQNPSSWPSRTRNVSSLAWWIWGGGAKPGGIR